MYVAFKTTDENIVKWLNSQNNKSQAIKNIITEFISKSEVKENPNAKIEVVVRE